MILTLAIETVDLEDEPRNKGWTELDNRLKKEIAAVFFLSKGFIQTKGDWIQCLQDLKCEWKTVPVFFDDMIVKPI